MSKQIDLLNQIHAHPAGDERLRLLDEGLKESLAWNETGYIALFAKLAGDTCEALGRLDRAVHYFELIPLHVGNDAWTYLSLGRLFFKLGDREKGLAHFKWCFQFASKKRGQKSAIKQLEDELRRNNLALTDLGI
jgi:tetratricopeptide (TPR) repeat protein